ncbi:MAG TPA: ATP-binding protein [Candidatus Dormibacteraeota bacterium]|nr:ATP-binding protein [Candidatus Dormibacteraeota bacterium]
MRGRRLGSWKRVVWSCVVASALALVLAEAGGTASAGAFGYSRSILPDAIDRTAADTARAVARDAGEQPLAPGQLRPLGYMSGPADPAALPERDFQWELVPGAAPVATEVAVDQSGTVVATSYGTRYPIGANLRTLVPEAWARMPSVLMGVPARGLAAGDGGMVAWSLHPILGSAGRPAGAVYVEVGLADAPTVEPALLTALVGVLLATVLLAGQRMAADRARARERDRIARELHESISQDLFALRLTLGGLASHPAADPALRAELDRAGQSLGSSIRQVRALLLELRPPRAAGMDLARALRELAASYRSRVGLAVEANVEAIRLPGDVQDGLLAIAQEAVANAARHAGAGRVTVSLRATAGGAELCVADDGRGFDPASEDAGRGLGRRLLDERTAEVGGTLWLDSRPGGGTRVVVAVHR